MALLGWLGGPRSRALLLAGALAVALGIALAAVRLGAWALIAAPNLGRPPGAEPIEIQPGSVAQQLRVAVGPPTASLAVWTFDPQPSATPRGTVFVLHGIRDSKRSMLGWAAHLTRAGYRAVLVDSRGHGWSSGDYLTYGVVESRDLSELLRALTARGLIAEPVGVVGVSYGAATAIEWAGREPRVVAVVAVAPFSSLREVVPGYLRHFAPIVSRLLPGFLIDQAIARAGQLAGFDPDEASPLRAIAHTRAAVLLVHGARDDHIPLGHSQRLRQAAAGPSELLILDGEDHDTVASDRQGLWWKRALEWLAQPR